MPFSKSPNFNLKVVLQETKIPADTLRAWERRYGLPQPERTAGGHRLYSQYDIEIIRWLLERQQEGLSISRAVDLWKEHQASGVDPLEGFAASSQSTTETPIIYVPPNTTLDSLRAKWIAACLKFSESNSEQVLNQAFSIFPIEAVCTEILQKGMTEIGSLWYEDRASVQQEHFASGLAMRRLDSLLSATPSPSRNQTVLVGCPSNEWHAFMPLLLSLLLRRRGLSVIHLGANVPVEQFEETVKSVKANLIILVAQTLITAATLQTTAQALTNLRVPVGYGGRIFNLLPELKQRIPGYFLGDSVTAALETVESLLQAKVKSHPPTTPTQEYLEAHRTFTAGRFHIESAVIEAARSIPISVEGLATGIQSLGDNIAAALQLGDMEYVTNEMDWLKTLLQTHPRPAQELADFMEIYSRAVDKHINGQGEPIKEWLKAQAGA
ncbi:MAG: MerR family transcriptional regulator [Chloroflexi bacterium]|nr:MerR family transcriptional regulator [Chloroflexota bacterium]